MRRLDTQYLDRDPDDGDDGRLTGAEMLGFVLRAAWRHRLLTVAVLLVGFGAATTYYLTKRPTYRVEVKLFAEKQRSVTAIDRPTVSDDLPTRTASDLVHHHQNLTNVIKQTSLLAAYAPEHRKLRESGVMDKLMALAAGESVPEEDDPVEALVNRLDRSLQVTVSDATVAISIDWPNAKQAYQIIEAVQQNFLEARHVQEITAIDEVIAILQGRATALRRELDTAIDETKRAIARGEGQASAAAGGAPARAGAPSGTEEIVRLRSMLEAKERAVRDVEDFRRRRLAELQSQLDEKRTVYADSYPAVQSLREDIAALSRESPQIVALRAEEQKLRAEYNQRAATNRGAAVAAAAAVSTPRPTMPLMEGSLVEQSERVRDARFKYQQMVERLNAAQLDLDAARSAFKYRYDVIWPAELPRKPFSPNPKKILGGGAIASILLALLAAAGLDLVRGRIVERWQVERKLAIPVIAELHD